MSLKSVVHEYEILYSTRMVQKEKRWSDGRLKYYEFNRKIEVHSDDNVLVVTEFYPHESRDPISNGAFADGMAFKFPSGKLIVEVTGYIGTFEREITVKREAPVKPEFSIKQEFQDLLSASEDFGNQSKSPVCSSGPKHLPSRQSGSSLASRGIIKAGPFKPVGLRKVKSNKSPDRPVSGIEATLQSYDSKLKKCTTRVPPGSNRLSIRLQKEFSQPSSYTD